MSGSGWVQLMRDEATLELMQDPNAFTLLGYIAYRAQRTNSYNRHGLKPGQALIGKRGECGLTEGEYRAAKERLAEGGLATFEGTNQGTIATLTNSEIYNINAEQNNDRNDDPATDKRRPRDGQTATTNKETRQEERNDPGNAATPNQSHPQPSARNRRYFGRSDSRYGETIDS